MLILQRKVGQSLLIGEEIQITVASVDAGRVRLAIEAPKSLSILRSELKTAILENQDAAQETARPQVLLGFLGEMGVTASPVRLETTSSDGAPGEISPRKNSPPPEDPPSQEEGI